VATSAVSTPRSVLLSADCMLQRSAGAGAETFLARLGLALGFPPFLFAAAFAAIAAAALIPRNWQGLRPCTPCIVFYKSERHDD